VTFNFDSQHLPRSFNEWEQLVCSCGVQDDTIETHWLERKGPLQLATAEHKFAVAKAILAFSNRDPAAAEPYLDGHAVLLIGIEKTGEITGIPRIEDHQLNNALKAYLGQDDDAPRWIAHRHRVDDHNDVVVIDIDAPRPGDPIFTLKKAYDNFPAGSIFSRPSTESAPADPSAIAALSRRLIARSREDFEVELTLNEDAISSYTYDPSFIEPLLAQAVDRYIRESEKPATPHTPTTGLRAGVFVASSPTGGIRHEEKRTQKEFRQEIEGWAATVREQLLEFAKQLAAYVRPAVQFTITNTCGRYLEDLEVLVHIEGDVFQHPKPVDDDDPTNWLPERPRTWGPWESSLFDYSRMVAALPSSLNTAFRAPRPNSSDFRNSGSVDAILRCRELRPDRSHTFTDDDAHEDIALLTTNIDMTTARIAATATARTINASHPTELIQPIKRVGDITTMLTDLLEALNYFSLAPKKPTSRWVEHPPVL